MTDDSNAADSELEQKLLWALRRARKLGLPEEDLRVLCYGCGIELRHVINPFVDALPSALTTKPKGQ